MSDALSYGERKHETCRFGTLAAAFIVSPWIEDERPTETPALIPICNWRIPDPHPPALSRGWGGAVEYERDCAVCLAHRPVEVEA